MKMTDFIEKMDREAELRKQGIETRKPVDHCTDCGQPLFESPMSADENPDADHNPNSDVPR